MNAKRLPRRGEVSREAIFRLIDTIQEIQFRLMESGSKDFMFMFEELRRPIKNLCMELDSPDLYERFMMKNERYFIKNMEIKEKISDNK